MPGCAAFGCSNRAEKGFLMKSFPRDPKRRKIWTAKVKRENWTPTNTSFLCELDMVPVSIKEETYLDSNSQLESVQSFCDVKKEDLIMENTFTIINSKDRFNMVSIKEEPNLDSNSQLGPIQNFYDVKKEDCAMEDTFTVIKSADQFSMVLIKEEPYLDSNSQLESVQRFYDVKKEDCTMEDTFTVIKGEDQFSMVLIKEEPYLDSSSQLGSIKTYCDVKEEDCTMDTFTIIKSEAQNNIDSPTVKSEADVRITGADGSEPSVFPAQKKMVKDDMDHIEDYMCDSYLHRRKYKCYALGCKSTSQEDPNLRFFHFPRDPLRSHLWANKIGRMHSLKEAKTLQYEHKVLCSKHFLHDQYTTAEKIRLNSTAVPFSIDSSASPSNIEPESPALFPSASSLSSVTFRTQVPIKTYLPKHKGGSSIRAVELQHSLNQESASSSFCVRAPSPCNVSKPDGQAVLQYNIVQRRVYHGRPRQMHTTARKNTVSLPEQYSTVQRRVYRGRARQMHTAARKNIVLLPAHRSLP